jgi:hypothetical protein
MSFYHLPHPWDPGYAIPEYVKAEPPERGTFTTKWLPRGTISAVVPDYLAQPGPKLLGRGDADLGSLGDDTLGTGTGEQVYTLQPLGAGGNAVTLYGKQAADWIMGSISRLPQEYRKPALRALLDAIDPKLWVLIEKKGADYSAKGMTPKASLHRAISEAMSAGIVEEVLEAGRRVMRGEVAVKKQSQLGLGLYPDAAHAVATDAMEALGFSLSSLNPVNWVKAGASAVASGARAVARGTRNAAGAVWDGTKWVGGKIADGASTAAGWVKAGAKALGGLACSLAGSSAGQLAAAAGGGPAAAAGAAAVGNSSMCSKGGAVPGLQAAATIQPPAPAGLPGWVLPVGIAAGGVGLILLMQRR